MPKYVIEMHYQRVPKQFVYNGEISAQQEGVAGSMVTQFFGKDLQDVAVSLHYLVRFVSSSGYEFCVRLEQRAPAASSTRRPVANELTVQQVNLIYESVETARSFLAPTHVRRDIRDGKAANQ